MTADYDNVRAENSEIVMLRSEIEKLRQDVAFLRQLLYQVRLEFQQQKRG